jgi:hypothetical protein
LLRFITTADTLAGTSSGAGKTTVASGLIGAWRARGRSVQGFKVGPDSGSLRGSSTSMCAAQKGGDVARRPSET